MLYNRNFRYQGIDFMIRRTSIAVKIGTYLLLILLLAGIMTSVGMLIIASHRSDAELINTTGSLRTQAYQLLYAMEHENKQDVQLKMLLHSSTLSATILTDLDRQYFVPRKIKVGYQDIIKSWTQMKQYAYESNYRLYRADLKSYVNQIDNFVLLLQKYMDRRNEIIVHFLLGMVVIIIFIVSYLIFFLYQRVTKPLKMLMLASSQIQIGQFENILVETSEDNEIGHLGCAFTQMSNTLKQLYVKLEGRMNEKTEKLAKVNRRLTMLYQCSQILTAKKLTYLLLQEVLHKVFECENFIYLKLDVRSQPNWNTELGEQKQLLAMQQEDLVIDDYSLGTLYWQSPTRTDERTIKNATQMIARAIFYYEVQKQQEYLLILEERSIIARELHDSLAQVLSFLKIQLSLLKRSLTKEENISPGTMTIVNDFEDALVSAYSQLRELLATFRLTIQEANLKTTLVEVVNSLQSQTNIVMDVDCGLPTEVFSAQDLIHILQIIREAILNAIKHSNAKHLDVIAHINENGEYEILVKDDGVGIKSLDEPAGHYGLNIMTERANRLGARLSILNNHGTEIRLIFKANRKHI